MGRSRIAEGRLKSSTAVTTCRSSSFDGFSQNPSSFLPPLPSIFLGFTSTAVKPLAISF
jgi:hypothetical protein